MNSIGRHEYNRRDLLAFGMVCAAAGVVPGAELGAATSPRLVFVHGRGQQGLHPDQLKSEWLDALRQGAQRSGRLFPAEVDVAFPYYGDILESFARAFEIPLTTDIQTKGSQVNDEFLAFQAELAEALRQRAGVTDAQVDAEYGSNPKPRGPLNWEWVQAILRAIDRYGGGISQAALETFTRDVFLYTTRAGVRDEIDRIVRGALTEDPTIVVGHSLGSVVAYNVLRSGPRTLRVPLFITVGCPLGLRAVRNQLRPLRSPSPVKAWYNAFDTRDIVALYPLDATNFPVTPAIENYNLVKNHTDNRHGIAGYLDDPEVAKRILTALGV
jgi:pimeloyl-ACP methyl ester carboxylesterase